MNISLIVAVRYLRTAFLICVISLYIKSESSAQEVDCKPQISDDREIRIIKPGDVINKRLEIIRAIWNDSKIPDTD